MNPKHQLITQVSQRLLIALGTLLLVLITVIITGYFIGQQAVEESPTHAMSATPFIVFIVGAIGGFVSLQRRLKELDESDLQLIADSVIYTCLAPAVGGVLAVLLYIIFLSGLLAGDLFPHFIPDKKGDVTLGFVSIFQTHGDYQAYAKLVFWAFVAGYSERFVIDILSQFQSHALDSAGRTTDNQEPQK